LFSQDGVVGLTCLYKQGCSTNNKVWESIQKKAILKQLKTHFIAKREKGVGTPFPHVPAPPHP